MDKRFLLNTAFCAAALICAVFAFLTTPLSAVWFAVFVAVYFLADKIRAHLKEFAADIAAALYAGAFTAYFSSFLLLSLSPDVRKHLSFMGFLMSRGPEAFFFEVLLVALLYLILRLAIKKAFVASAIAPLPFAVVALLDYYVYNFRGNEVIAADITSARTALNVASSYDFFDFLPIVVFVGPYILYIVTVVKLHFEDKRKGTRFRTLGITLAVFAACMALCSVLCVKTHQMKVWKNEGSANNGVFLNIILSVPAVSPKMPDGYDIAALDSTGVQAIQGDGRRPNIIIIMNEAMTDVTAYNIFDNNFEDPMPFLHQLAQDDAHAVTGFALSSVYGGNTAISEFEMLTGVTTAYLPQGAIPYTLYIDRPIVTVATVLKDQGYDTVAMHPYPGSGYNRDVVYPLLGFDRSYFMESFDYDDSHMIRTFLSDQRTYENMLAVIDSHEANSDRPLFTFLVTVQNHGGYDDPTDNFVPTQYVEGHPDANLFISLMKRTDDALQFLIEELSQRDEEYIIMMFGDHHPALQEFSDDMTPGGEAWAIPYFIWDNKGLDTGAGYSVRDGAGRTDISYLGLETLLYSGVDIPEYFAAINDIREQIPSINAAGYYSASTGGYVPLNGYEDNGSASEAAAIDLYRYIQYDVLFDENDSALTSLS